MRKELFRLEKTRAGLNVKDIEAQSQFSVFAVDGKLCGTENPIELDFNVRGLADDSRNRQLLDNAILTVKLLSMYGEGALRNEPKRKAC